MGPWVHNAMQMQSNTATEQDSTIQTSLRFDAMLHEQARLLAFKKKTTLQQIVNEALRAYLAKQKAA
jgi:predicted HicB family RNase H-like nuclease